MHCNIKSAPSIAYRNSFSLDIIIDFIIGLDAGTLEKVELAR